MSEEGPKKSAEKLAVKLLEFQKLTDESEKEKYWKEMAPIFKRVIFFVGFGYDGEDINQMFMEPIIHCFPGAAMMINEKHECPDFSTFELATKADTRMMKFRTLKNPMTGEEYLSAFTSFDQMMPVWQFRCRYALATFDDMKDCYKPSLGILVNCMSGCLRINPEKIEFIDKEGKQ